ncbi:MAG: T9SS type A sorting domain-containing protein [bacterium]|nr:T9SS type A sorting domain-containing protein [bacterium]
MVQDGTSVLRRFGTIAGFCMLRLGTDTLGTCSDITVSIGTDTSTTTDSQSYFVFGHLPVGNYTLNFNTWGAAPVNLPGICITTTQFEDTTYIGTISLLAGDTNNDGNVNMTDWGVFRPAWCEKATTTHINWETYKEGDFNHDGIVDAKDFIVFRINFGKQQQPEGKAKKLTPMPAKAKKTSAEIKLSFNIETLEGVDKNDLRVGNIIYLKVCIRDAKDFLGGEIHLSFNPDVLEVVNAPVPSTTLHTCKINRIPLEKGEIGIQAGDYLKSLKGNLWEFMNKVDNKTGKIDYAVGVSEPQTTEEGEFAVIPFRIKACGVSSDVNFDFEDEENRETIFVAQPTTKIIGEPVEVQSEKITIKVPLVFNDLNSTIVYPNPVRKGEVTEITFTNLPSPVPIMLKIFNIAGELVFEGEKTSSGNKITWDLRNKDNEYVSSGIYIYLLEYQGLTKKGKIGVIK